MSQEDAKCTPPSGSGSSFINDKSFDRSSSQGSDRLSQPLSQETFNQLWTTLEEISDHGNLTQIMMQPLDSSGVADLDSRKNCIEMEVDQHQIEPKSSLAAVSSSPNHYFSPDSVMSSSKPSDNSADPGETPPTYIPPLQQSIATPTVPSTTEYMGDYGFEIYMASSQTFSKAATWTYSDIVKKLYVKMAVTCPIKFKTHTSPPPDSIIRAMPVFKSPEYVKEVVKQCPNHASMKVSGLDHPFPSHFLRCENIQARYTEDPTTSRQSVSVPYENPQVGTEYITYLYAFMCFTSCVGGLNRRPIQVIFQLEKDNVVLGRRVLDVRICACPGRDRKSDEKRCHPPPKQIKRGASKTAGFQMSVGSKRRKGDDDVYTLIVRGRENYEFLLKMKEALELMS
ncbi:tumor protein 63-like, partial [Saccoglossus kowalevskii]|uniref:Tumor protein 63-like n=1 Tax=Saccoglossus kowalevskii TaxID=10224 RepID=A0ABM0GWE2_SACKO